MNVDCRSGAARGFVPAQRNRYAARVLDAPNDTELLHAWRSGDRKAGQSLVKRHYGSVYRFISGKVGDDSTADLTQGTFEVLCRKRDSFEERSSMRTYILAIARWRLVGHFRKHHEEAESFEPSLHGAPGSDIRSMTSMVALRRETTLVMQALRSLTLDDQIIIELREYEGLTATELGQLFEIPASTARGRLMRARTRLREVVETLAQAPELQESTINSLSRCMQEIRHAHEHRSVGSRSD